MVLDDYVARVRAVNADRAKRLSSIRTKKEAFAYRDEVREAIDNAYRPWPSKTPLNARVVGTIERRHYRIEKILFESRPGCLVTAHLYVPDKLDGPAPGIIGSCGHAADGKNASLYQAFCQRLARNGFVVLIYDPFNQGERDQYYALHSRESVRSSTHAHNMMGKQLELVGEWFGAWRTWDGIRALDYLLTRPEVDSAHIGLTGNSGGGTMTSWIWPVEERFTMAAPSCFVTTFAANLENELPADSEQYPPGVIGAGLDMADFFIARAPSPVILLGQAYCFFDRRGLKQAYSEVRRFYDIIGAPANATDIFIGSEDHGFFRDNQEAMVRFFATQAGIQQVTSLEETEDLSDVLNVTPKGEVVSEGATPIYDLIAQKADVLASKRKKLGKDELTRCVQSTLNLSDDRDLPHHRWLRSTTEDGVRLARYAVETEGNIRAIMRKRLSNPSYSHTLDVEREVHLYLPHVSAEEDLIEDPFAKSLKEQHPLYALDVRGLGESLADDERDFFHPYGNDYMCNGYGLMLGQSFLGRRVHDVLSTLDLLVDEGAQKIHLYGRGQGAIHALFAGFLHSGVTTITLKNYPPSYHAWTQTPLVSWPAANIPRGVLTSYDLPDLMDVVDKKLALIQPWGADMGEVGGEK
jgi:dienelactone hydrolase